MFTCFRIGKMQYFCCFHLVICIEADKRKVETKIKVIGRNSHRKCMEITRISYTMVYTAVLATLASISWYCLSFSISIFRPCFMTSKHQQLRNPNENRNWTIKKKWIQMNRRCRAVITITRVNQLSNVTTVPPPYERSTRFVLTFSAFEIRSKFVLNETKIKLWWNKCFSICRLWPLFVWCASFSSTIEFGNRS